MFERMLIGRIENRILVGVLAFLVTMIVLGWAAINEGGRMVAFAESEHARSIEQGADTFASTCSTCHGTDGRGGGRAPGLNNPQFFGHDFFPDITKQVDDLTAEKVSLNNEQTNLNGELTATDTTDARKTEINTRIGEITTRITEIDAQVTVLNTQRSTDVQAAVDNGYDPARFDRLKNLQWGGTREGFIVTTLIHGRPVSGNYWPAAMPTWSQLGSGPLRMDQLEDLAAYIMNWDKGENWTLDDLFAVGKFAIEPVDGAPLEAQIEILQESGGVLPEKIGTDIQAILAKLPEFTGDAAHGDQLYHGTDDTKLGNKLICNTCHLQEANSTGPMANGIYTRITDIRLQDPLLAGYTPEQYIVESITHPGNYVVPNFANVMPPNFGEQITYQDLADIIAYLETLK